MTQRLLLRAQIRQHDGLLRERPPLYPGPLLLSIRLGRVCKPERWFNRDGRHRRALEDPISAAVLVETLFIPGTTWLISARTSHSSSGLGRRICSGLTWLSTSRKTPCASLS